MGDHEIENYCLLILSRFKIFDVERKTSHVSLIIILEPEYYANMKHGLAIKAISNMSKSLNV